MERKLYPIGIQTFEEIRRLDNLYIDKTEYIYRMTHTNGKYFFLSRPRRFGKSLLVSTFLSYFEGKMDLFNGLAIEKLEKEWQSYPVLHFSMAGGKHMEKDALEDYLRYVLKENEAKFGIQCEDKDTNIRMMNLIRNVYQQTGRQVVLLIDDYDAPLLDFVYDEKKLREIIGVLDNFFAPVKSCDAMIRFFLMTGVTRYNVSDITGILNNMRNITMDDQYGAICGFTEEEVVGQLSDSIDSLAKIKGETQASMLQKLRNKYGGYRFTWPSPELFNPDSLLKCFADSELGTYWMDSGISTYLMNMMKKHDFLSFDFGKRVWAVESSVDASTETMYSFMPLLYKCGCLAIKGYEKDSELYEVALANEDVKASFC